MLSFLPLPTLENPEAAERVKELEQEEGLELPNGCWSDLSFKSAGRQNSDFTFKTETRDFPGGAVVKNPPANAGDMGSSPGPGGSHMPQSN